MKKVETLIILLTLAAFAGCGAQEQKAQESSQVKTELKKPSIDIFAAAVTGNIEEIKLHIANGSDLNAKEPMNGSSPLITAIVFDKIEAAEMFIEAGADINQKNNDESTPLFSAAVFGRVEAIKLLVEKGADKSIKNKEGITASEFAAIPFDKIKPLYDFLKVSLGPMGVKFDYEYLKGVRPKIVEMLK